MCETLKEVRGKNVALRVFRVLQPDNPRDKDNFGTMVCSYPKYHLGDETHRSARSYARRIIQIAEMLDSDSLRKMIHEKLVDGPFPDATEEGNFTAAVMGFSTTGDLDAVRGFIKKEVELLITGSPCTAVVNIAKEIIEKRAVLLPLYLYDGNDLVMKTTRFDAPWKSGCVGFIFVSNDDVERRFGKGKNAARKARQALEHEVEVYNSYLRKEIYGFTLIDLETNKTLTERRDICELGSIKNVLKKVVPESYAHLVNQLQI